MAQRDPTPKTERCMLQVRRDITFQTRRASRTFEGTTGPLRTTGVTKAIAKAQLAEQVNIAVSIANQNPGVMVGPCGSSFVQLRGVTEVNGMAALAHYGIVVFADGRTGPIGFYTSVEDVTLHAAKMMATNAPDWSDAAEQREAVRWASKRADAILHATLQYGGFQIAAAWYAERYPDATPSEVHAWACAHDWEHAPWVHLPDLDPACNHHPLLWMERRIDRKVCAHCHGIMEAVNA